MKKTLSLISALIILLISIQTTFAADFSYALAVESKLQTGKSFNAEITVSGGGNVAAVIFTVYFDSSVIEYSSASLSDGTDGKLESYCDGGTLKLVFLNTKGISLGSDNKGIITLKFKATSTPCNTFITVYGEQAVNAQEVRLSCDSGIEYSVELAEKVSGTVSLAQGSTVSGSSSENEKSQSSGAKSKQSSGDTKKNGVTSYPQSSNASFGSASDSESNLIMIIFGFIIALCVMCAALGIYTFGKKRAEMQLEQKQEIEEKDAAQPTDNNSEQHQAAESNKQEEHGE